MLENAVKFTREASQVTIHARREGDCARCEIADQCGGMAPDLPPRLFQSFVQGSTHKSGFGLGLGIVKQSAEAHGGSVEVENRPPEGCTFILKVPLAQPTRES